MSFTTQLLHCHRYFFFLFIYLCWSRGFILVCCFIIFFPLPCILMCGQGIVARKSRSRRSANFCLTQLLKSCRVDGKIYKTGCTQPGTHPQYRTMGRKNDAKFKYRTNVYVRACMWCMSVFVCVCYVALTSKLFAVSPFLTLFSISQEMVSIFFCLCSLFFSILSGPICSLFFHLTGARAHTAHTEHSFYFLSRINPIETITHNTKEPSGISQTATPMRQRDMLHGGKIKKKRKNEKQPKYICAFVCVLVWIVVHCIAVQKNEKKRKRKKQTNRHTE